MLVVHVSMPASSGEPMQRTHSTRKREEDVQVDSLRVLVSARIDLSDEEVSEMVDYTFCTVSGAFGKFLYLL